VKKELVTDLMDMLDELISNHGERLSGNVGQAGRISLSFSRQENTARFSLDFRVEAGEWEDEE
jgi:hypothetical protein